MTTPTKKSPLRAVRDEARFCRLWNDPSLTVRDISEIYQIGTTTVWNTAKRLNLGCKPLDTPEMLPGDPTPEEIEERCAALRATWPKWRLLGLDGRAWADADGYIATIDVPSFTTDRIHGGFKVNSSRSW